nr:MAG TPA: hypothetical protein [Bacteriophage sp.]
MMVQSQFFLRNQPEIHEVYRKNMLLNSYKSRYLVKTKFSLVII